MWLKTTLDGGTHLKLIWGDKEGYYPYPLNYTVGVDTLRKAAAQVRSELTQLALWARNRNPQQLPGILKNLATSGQRLRFAIFDPIPYVAGIPDLLQWISTHHADEDRQLHITADPTIHVPWGLVFDGSAATAGATLESLSELWCLKYDLSVVLSGFHPPKRRANRQRAKFRMISSLNRSELTQAHLENPTAIAELLNFHDLPVGKAFTVSDTENLIDEAASHDALFYFFGHGRDGSLVLDEQDTIDVLTFKMLMERLAQRSADGALPCNLVFLNACDSAVGDSDYTLRSAAARPGICGLVATEALVPRKFAVEFGLDFLTRLVKEGNSIEKTMRELRRDMNLWPLSLLYGCYAYPNYQISDTPA